jgi:hypothetical protein
MNRPPDFRPTKQQPVRKKKTRRDFLPPRLHYILFSFCPRPKG